MLLFLLLVLIPVQTGLHFWPNWSLVNGIRVDYLSPTIYLTDLIILFIYFCNRIKIRIPLLVIVFVTLNIFYSFSPSVSLYKWFRILEYYWLFRYLVNNILRASLPFALAIVYTSILTFLQFVKQGSVGGLWYLLGERSINIFTPHVAKVFWQDLVLRSYATFPHPNVLGGWLVLAGLLAGRLFRALAFTALIFTFSRTAQFSAGMAVMIIKRKVFLLPLLLLFFLVPGSPDSFPDRLSLVRTSVNIIRDNPLFGTGLGNFVQKSSQPVHNIFLLAASELGLPLFGLLSFLAIDSLGRLFKFTNLKVKAMFAVITITSLADHYWWTIPQMQLLFTFLLAYAVEYSHVQTSDIYRRRIAG